VTTDTTLKLYPTTTLAMSMGEWVDAPTVYVVLDRTAYCLGEHPRGGVCVWAAPLSSQGSVRWDLLAPAAPTDTTAKAAFVLDTMVWGG
jgi:hypothetical protein